MRNAPGQGSIVAIVSLSLCLGLQSCDDSSRIQALSDQASQLTREWTPKLEAASAQLVKLRSRVAMLPQSQAADVDQSMSHISSRIQTARMALSVLPTKIESAREGGKLGRLPHELQQVSDTVSGSLLTFSNEVDGVSQRITALESEVALGRFRGLNELAAPYEKRLPSGYVVVGNVSGIEQQVLSFVENSEASPKKSAWFTFDRIFFTEITPELEIRSSAAQLDNLAEILLTFHNTRLQIGGYTDNSGAFAAAKQLSKQRALRVLQELIDRGVDKRRLSAEGYGPLHPACPPNDTDECRAQNQRVALRVISR
jgi:outer membrane protein OmpA-like peptidoglycan-associated protein